MGRPELDAAAQQSTLQQAQDAIAGQTNFPRPTTHDAFLQQIDLTDHDLAEDDPPLPAYGETYGEIRDGKNGTGASAIITDDGRVNININHFNRRLSQIFTPALYQHVQDAEDSGPPAPPYIPPSLGGTTDVPPPPRLNIVIQVVGSRGDVQPFVALGKVLKETYGHRVRLATHPTFKTFIQENGLEFFSIGGDPARLMAFMVKNPGLRPGFRSVASGDVGQRRKDVAEYIQGCWRSCYQADDGTDGNLPEPSGSDAGSESTAKHFVADCIIANPPSFAHIHCAEKLGIPLHIMFTMPYSPTQAFPHPLANVQSSNADPQLTNYFSYALIELLSWQVLGDIINRFRVKCLGLDPVSRIWGPGMLERLKIPHTYCWSPALIPKPKDWGSYISISGFYFLNLTSNYTPANNLQAFLNNGPPPVYIGFGSIVLGNPGAMTQLIFEATRKTGQRILLSKGWGGIGKDELHNIPDGIFMLDNVPHDWLFKHVSCVVHHGGAGTTAAGITAGRPTVVIPFFGDQPFWGSMVARAGAGPDPISYKQLTADKLADAINFCLRPESLENAKQLASRIATEQGCDTGAQLFHQFLEPDRLRCNLAPSRPGVWRVKRTKIKLSAFAACTLANENLLDFQDLKLFRAQEHYIDEGPWDPVSGGFTASMGAVGGMMMGLADIPSETWRALQIPAGRSRQQSQTLLPTIANESEASLVGDSSMPSRSSGQSVRRPQDPARYDTSLSRAHTWNEAGPSKAPDMLRPTGVHMSKGAGRFVKALVQGPVDISVNLTRGMHNIPKIWGDKTVRPQERVSDFRSGVKAVGREFSFGFYDGMTGIVTQPWRGAQAEGASGFVKGVGKGIGGILVKPGAACLGILSHTMQGVSKEVQKLFGSNVQNYIIASRAAQGYEEWLQSSDAEKQDVIVGWKRIQKDLKKKVKSDDPLRENRKSQQKKSSEDSDDQQKARRTTRPTRSVNSAESQIQSLNSTTLAMGGSIFPLRVDNTALRTSSGQANLRQAVATNEAEAQRRASVNGSNLDLYRDDDDERYEQERREFQATSERAAVVADMSTDHQPPPSYDLGHVMGTTRSKFEADQKGQQREKTTQEKAEEDIVMEYTKKQSLLEEHHQGKDKGRGTVIEEEDEELQKVLKLSMQEYTDRHGEAPGR
ncbi:glucosyl/glucuronosyl transferase [Pyrenophora tritici-repentis]|nr:glucosyl/glucuronosyl transferase [Pyrenophora tritici-repentis]